MNQGSGLLTNQLYRLITPFVTPALSFGFAVDGGEGIEENISRFRSIPKKCYNLQTGATLEGINPDAGDPITNRDACQFIALREGILPDTGDAVRYRDTRQVGTVTEG